MIRKNLANWLKAIIIGTLAFGIVVYFVVIPVLGRSFADANPESTYCFLPWLIFIWITAVPCYAVLIFGWRIAENIGRNHSFCKDNARYMKYVSYLALADSALFFFGSIVFLLLNMNHPGVFLLSLLVSFGGVLIAVASAILSHLILKAADIQEQNDLTI